jgi:very-short-patch-repair endonuclease
MINLCKGDNFKKSLFDYLTECKPSILTKFVGDLSELNAVSYTIKNYYTWRCNTSECLNTFEAVPYQIYKTRLPRTYCDTCSQRNRDTHRQLRSLERSGSIQEKIPEIETIWSKDNKKTPKELTPGSNEKVKLICPNNRAKHPEYEISVYHIQESYCIRCPKCITKTSNAEIRIYSELKHVFKDVKWQQKIGGREADITVEDVKLVIEVDGFPWHKDKTERDLLKNCVFETNGYSILRIRDIRLEQITGSTLVCNVSNIPIADYNKIIEWINNKFKCNINLIDDWKNLEYYKEIQASLLSIEYDKSIEYLFPESKQIWDYEKNYPFIPSQFTQGSDMDIWVKCSSGHSWKRKLSHLFRTIKGKKCIMKCPECNEPKSNKRTIQINGISYRSILELCRQKDIDRHKLYKKMRDNGIDSKIITNIQTFIEKNIEILKITS